MAMAAAAASRQTASSTASSSSTRVTDTTSRVARSRMEEAAPASTAPLTGDPSTSYDFDNELTTAEEMRLADSRGVALGYFNIIYGNLERITLPRTSFFPARCLLGLADCSDPGEDRTYFAQKAYEALNLVYDHRNDWSPEEASPAYSELKWLLTKLKLLIVVEQPLASTEIARKIVECQKHILPIDYFKERVKEGDDYFKAQETLDARKCYKAALLRYQHRKEIEFMVARVPCLLQLTRTYEQAEPDRALYLDQAQNGIFLLYGSSAALFMKDGLSSGGLYTRVDAYKLLLCHLRALRELTPAREHETLSEIQWRIDSCEREIPDEVNNIRLRKAPPPAAPSGPSGRGSAPPPGSPPRKVTPRSPDGSCNLCKLLIACVFIAALTAVGVALYRRYTVKVD